jgi:hypothetical protein
MTKQINRHGIVIGPWKIGRTHPVTAIKPAVAARQTDHGISFLMPVGIPVIEDIAVIISVLFQRVGLRLIPEVYKTEG